MKHAAHTESPGDPCASNGVRFWVNVVLKAISVLASTPPICDPWLITFVPQRMSCMLFHSSPALVLGVAEGCQLEVQ